MPSLPAVLTMHMVAEDSLVLFHQTPLLFSMSSSLAGNNFQLIYFTERVGTEKSPSLIFICPVQVKILLKCLFPVSDARGGLL